MLALFDTMFGRLVSLGFLLAALSSTRAQTPLSLQEIPFRYNEGLLWVQLQVPESEKPLTFLLDSGASVNVLHLPTARKLGLKLGNKLKIQGVNGVVTGYKCRHFSAQIGNLPLL